MKKIQVSAQVPEKKDSGGKVTQQALGPATVTVEYPETFEEARSVYTEEAVLSNALSNFKVILQANIRSGLKKGENQAALQARLGSAKMGIAVQKGALDHKAALLAQAQSGGPAAIKALIAELQARLKG